MPRFVCKFGDDQYLMWSTVVDAPVTYMMTRDEMLTHCGDPDRVARADQYGTSIIPEREGERRDLKSLVGWNRAGLNESHLTIEEIVKEYTKT